MAIVPQEKKPFCGIWKSNTWFRFLVLGRKDILIYYAFRVCTLKTVVLDFQINFYFTAYNLTTDWPHCCRKRSENIAVEKN